MATVLPGYLPSVFLGLRSNRLAPAAYAMAWHMLVLPVLGAPYNSRDRIRVALHSSHIYQVHSDNYTAADWPGVWVKVLIVGCEVCRRHHVMLQ